MTEDMYPVEIERRIVERVIDDALERGFTLGVNDGEETVLENSSDRAAVLAAMFSTDEDYLHVSIWNNGERTFHGWARFIYGNGTDVLSDDSGNIDIVLAGANGLADWLAESTA